jgi:hypothetical protein
VAVGFDASIRPAIPAASPTAWRTSCAVVLIESVRSSRASTHSHNLAPRAAPRHRRTDSKRPQAFLRYRALPLNQGLVESLLAAQLALGGLCVLVVLFQR